MFQYFKLETIYPKIATHFTILCVKMGKMDNTVLGYKKGSKLNSEVGFATATTKLYMVIFVTFLKKVVSHSSKYR